MAGSIERSRFLYGLVIGDKRVLRIAFTKTKVKIQKKIILFPN